MRRLPAREALRARGMLLGALLTACSPVREQAIPVPEPAEPAPVAVVVVPVAAPAPLAPWLLDAEAERWVEATLGGLTLRQRVAQLVVPWISGQPESADAAEWQRMLEWAGREEVGGLIVSRGSPGDLARKLNAAQRHARVPLLVVSDLETGPGMRLSPGGTNLPPAMAFGAAGDERLAREAGRVTGAEARAVGIHVTLGPVLDLNTNPANPIINIRSFGEDPERVARLASAWTAGARDAGLLAVGKHFPGHGDTRVDSHVGLATITADSARLHGVELVPFRRTADAGLIGIMLGHIAVPALDEVGLRPASLSPRIVGGLLRGSLGFRGLLFTDALNMGAITRSYSTGEAAIRALGAGVDVLLQPPGTSSVIDAVVHAVESGRLPRERIDDAARQMLRAKAAAGLHHGARVAPDSVRFRVGTPGHEALARAVAAASVTLVRDDAGLVPFTPGVRHVLHIAYREAGSGTTAATLRGEFAAHGLRVDYASVNARTSETTFRELGARAASADRIIVSVALSPRQNRALGLDGRFADFVRQISASGAPVVVVSLGSPYLLDSFPTVPAYLLAWSAAGASQWAAVRALLGRAPITGRLPVSLPPHYLAGEGLVRGALAD